MLYKLNFSKASKKQLLTICLYEEDCPQCYIHAALWELRQREQNKQKIMDLYDFGWDTWDIAEETGINLKSVSSMIGGINRRKWE